METNYNQPIDQVPVRVDAAPTFTEEDHSPMHWVWVEAPISADDFSE